MTSLQKQNNKSRFQQMKLALLASVVLLGGCSLFSGSGGETREPNKLPEITNTITLEKVWSQSVGNGADGKYLNLRPALSGNTLVAADAEGLVKAFDRDTGKSLWATELEIPASGAVSANRGLVLVGSLNGDVAALSLETGKELWRSTVSSEVLSAPVTDGSVVIVHSIDEKLTGLNASSGEKIWEQSVSQPVLRLRGASTPLMTGGLVIDGFANGEVRAYDAAKGVQAWDTRIAAPKGNSELERLVDIEGRPLLISDVLYVVGFQGNIAALDPATGRVRWARESSSYQSMAAGFGSLYVAMANGWVSAVDQRTGATNWRQEKLEGRRLSGPVTHSSYVAVGDYEGYVHFISQVDGQFAGRIQVDSDGLRTQLLSDGELLFAYGNGGDLVALKIR
ncbi:outer membrane protein assembly factor BamB [Spongorhabdus nitratireducens]